MGNGSMPDDYIQILQEAILIDSFEEAVFQGAQRGATIPWERVTIRPVLVKGTRHLQIARFDGKQDRSQNHRGEEARV